MGFLLVLACGNSYPNFQLDFGLLLTRPFLGYALRTVYSINNQFQYSLQICYFLSDFVFRFFFDFSQFLFRLIVQRVRQLCFVYANNFQTLAASKFKSRLITFYPRSLFCSAPNVNYEWNGNVCGSLNKCRLGSSA